jgi:hypothetical protein
MEKMDTNKASWLPVRTKKWKKRTPIRLLGYLKEQKMEKESTNKAAWLFEEIN